MSPAPKSTSVTSTRARRSISIAITLLMAACTLQAQYLKEGSIRRAAGQVVYDVKKSQTDLLSIQIGVAFRF